MKYTGTVDPLMDRTFMRSVMGAAFRKLIDTSGVMKKIMDGQAFSYGFVKFKGDDQWHLSAKEGDAYLWGDYGDPANVQYAGTSWLDCRWNHPSTKEREYFAHA